MLALSTATIAYQDALARFANYADASDRFQVERVVNPKTGVASAARIFPDVVRSVAGLATDRTTTGSIPAAAAVNAPGAVAYVHPINRTGKTDLAINRRPISAGVIQVAGLFAPAVADQLVMRTAFALPETPKPLIVALPTKPLTATAATAAGPSSVPDATAPVAAAAAPTAVASVEGAEAPVAAAATTKVALASIMMAPMPRLKPAPKAAPETLLAYANPDEAESAPFTAVMGAAPKGLTLLDPKIDDKHAWVNLPLPASAKSATEVKCLATAIYFEARGESEKGQIGVAQVVLNRLKNPAYPDTICSVVYQNKNKRNRCQFSFACDGITDRITDKRSWAASQALARRILNDERTLYMASVGAATHYHATYVKPRWARSMKRMDKIGRHVFYKTRNGGWS